MNNTLKVIITGSTGMVGEGVLFECLKHPRVESVLVINRRSCGVKHEKLTEIIHNNFLNISPIKDGLSGYNACYFCLGVSSMGMKETKYRQITYDLTMHVAKTLHAMNPEMVFTYVSGKGTDSTAKGRIMWARVKGRTENDLLNLFNKVYMFRPGYIQPTRGLKNTYKIYKVLAPFYPIWKTFFPNYVCTLQDIGLAMINCTINGYEKPLLENTDIAKAALIPD